MNVVELKYWNKRVSYRIRSVPSIVFCVLMLGSLVVTETRGQWIEATDLVSPLVDNEPFDLLYLNKNADNAILKIFPLKEPLASPMPERANLVFDFATDTGEQFQVPYASIEQHKTFNDLLIEEANRWLQEQEYSAAFRNLLYVYDHGGKDDDALVKSLRNCLFLDATENFRAGRFELSLSIFEDIYARTPDFQIPGINKKLVDIILLCYDGILQKDFDSGEFLKVRRKMEAVNEKYADAAQALVEKWTNAFVSRAEDLLAEAKKHAAQGNGRLAHLASRQAEQINPGNPNIKPVQEEILKQYPLIVVGASQPAGDANGQRLEHWGARRVGRLIHRSIVELTGLSDEGGKYNFLNGSLTQADEMGLKYVMEIASTAPVFAAPPANAFLISSRLLAAANPQSALYEVAWEKILDNIEIVSDDQVIITLRLPFVRPEALLEIPYAMPLNAADFQDNEGDQVGDVTQNGVYRLTETNNNISTFEFNPQYKPLDDRQYPVLIEQLFGSASDAVDELIKGSIDVVDRIPVADITRLKSEPGIVVRPYAIPTVHMLIPKIRGELADDLFFRSGLSHAINREVLVNDAICDGAQVTGCEPLSGPFPVGTEENDQLSYGYDLKIRPAAFNSKLAMVLIQLALRPTKKRPLKLTVPSLVLAYPDSSSAAQAAGAIAQMWNDVGVPTTTLQLKPGLSIPTDDQWDFLYLEASIEEPLTDISKIIGRNGIAQDVSAPVEQTLRLVSYATSWRTACNALRRLHRQLSVDLSVIPLWQIKEHYAYRNTVTGVGRDLIHLYQNVDRWQIDSFGTDEKE